MIQGVLSQYMALRHLFDTCNQGISCRGINVFRLCKNVLLTTLPSNMRPSTLLTQTGDVPSLSGRPVVDKRVMNRKFNYIETSNPRIHYSLCCFSCHFYFFNILTRDQQFQHTLTAQSFQTGRSMNNS